MLYVCGRECQSKSGQDRRSYSLLLNALLCGALALSGCSIRISHLSSFGAGIGAGDEATTSGDPSGGSSGSASSGASGGCTPIAIAPDAPNAVRLLSELTSNMLRSPTLPK